MIFFADCAPKQCGRFVTDLVVSPEEAAHLLRYFRVRLLHDIINLCISQINLIFLRN